MKKFLVIFLMIIGFVEIRAQDFARGADVSWLSEMEQSKRIWKDSVGVQRDLLDILDDYCINAIRLRVWVNPNNGWSSKQDMISLAKRAKAKGYRLMIDFHYSDSWADPGQQTKPIAWLNFSVPQLEQAIYDHTFDVLSALKMEGVYPEWVQVGNETNDGMLWPEGRASLNNNANMVNYAKFVDKGYSAVKNVFPLAKVVVHVANGYDNVLFKWNIGGLIANKARFDVIGMSMYPELVSDWQNYASQSLLNMQDMVSRFGKEIIVSEIGLASNSPVEGRKFVEKTIQNVQSLGGKKGIGVFWWEPEAYDWKGYGKVAWNSNVGANPFQATEAMKGFKRDCSDEITKSFKVTFNVNMLGQNTSNGVYITGSMTELNGNWQIIPMINMGNGIYTSTFTVMHKDTIAYYYLNANNWSNREVVPTNCATSYNTDRTYYADSKATFVEDNWASCNKIITKNQEETLQLDFFPNPFSEYFILKSNLSLHYSICSVEGLVIDEGETRVNELNFLGKDLVSGMYILKLFNSENQQFRTLKMIKK